MHAHAHRGSALLASLSDTLGAPCRAAMRSLCPGLPRSGRRRCWPTAHGWMDGHLRSFAACVSHRRSAAHPRHAAGLHTAAAAAPLEPAAASPPTSVCSPFLPLAAVLKTSVISQASGSAYAEFGRTKVGTAAGVGKPDLLLPARFALARTSQSPCCLFCTHFTN